MNALIFFFILVGVGFSAPTKASDDEIHIVRKGDTLSEIAQIKSISVKILCEHNELEDCNRIFPGQEIRIPFFLGKEESQPVSLPLTSSSENEEVIVLKEEGEIAPASISFSEEEVLLEEGVSGFTITTDLISEEVFSDKNISDAEVFKRNQELQGYKEEVTALQKQVSEQMNYKERTNSILQLQKEKISSYTLWIFLSVLGNIFFFLFLMKDIIKKKLWRQKSFFYLPTPKKEEENTEAYNLRCEINALKNKNKFLEEQIKIVLQKRMLLSISGKSYEVLVSHFDLDRLTKKVIPIVTFLSEGKRFTLKIFNVKRFEKWLAEDTGRIFQILDPVLATR